MGTTITPTSRKMTADRLFALAIMLGGCGLFLSPVVIELIHWSR